MTNGFIMGLNRKITLLNRRKLDAKAEYDRIAAEVDKEIAELEKAVKVINEAVGPYICPRCHGSGEESFCDAAGDTDTRSCPACHGTGVKVTGVKA